VNDIWATTFTPITGDGDESDVLWFRVDVFSFYFPVRITQKSQNRFPFTSFIVCCVHGMPLFVKIRIKMSPRLNLVAMEDNELMSLESSHEHDETIWSTSSAFDVVELLASIPTTKRLMCIYHVALAMAVAILLIGNTLFVSLYFSRQVPKQMASILENSRRERETIVTVANERYHETSNSQLLQVLEQLRNDTNVIDDAHQQSSSEVLGTLEETDCNVSKCEEEILYWRNQVEILHQQLSEKQKEISMWKRTIDIFQQKLIRSRRELGYCANTGCHVLEI
jgi:hypothetical protein